jgi:hypothetical protein
MHMKRFKIGKLTMFTIGFVFLTSCVTLKHIPSKSLMYGIDFKKYSEKEFLFTPEKYQGEYLTVGIIEYVLYPEANYLKESKTGITKWVVNDIKMENA